ncbi:lipid A biosynthesis acyltransferase [Planctomycetes bacterium Pan216]
MARKKRNNTVDYLVYLVIRIVVAVIQALPVSAGYSLARMIGWLGYTIDKRHRRIALENVRHAFGDDLSAKQQDRLVRGVYVHFAKVIVEIAHIPRKLHSNNWKRYVNTHEVGDTIGLLLRERATILVTGHFGNWEMAGYLIAVLGIESFAIARTLDNPYLHDFVLRFRQWSGQTILSKNGDMDRILQVLSDRQFLISVGDQAAGPRGYFIDFFGRPASTHKSVAVLALRYDAAITIGYSYRDRDSFHYHVGVAGIIDPRDYANCEDAAFEMTREFNRQLERVIRLAPSQYLWLHNRWKHKPPTPVAKAKAA